MQHIQGLTENFEKLCGSIKLCHCAKHLPYLFSQVFYWNKLFCVYDTVSHLHKKAPSHCPCNTTALQHPFPQPELDLHRWEWAFHFNLCDILISPSLNLILCENYKVICCLRWSAFRTPPVGVGCKQGPDPENNNLCAYVGCASCPTSEIVIQKCNFYLIYLDRD